MPGVRGNVTVVRHGVYRRLHRVVPFSWSSQVPNVGQWLGSPIPPDVRLAGEALQDESALGQRRNETLDGVAIM